MPVLPWTSLDDQVSCAAPLPERQTQGNQRRGIGRKGSRRYLNPTRQPQVGKTALEIPRALGRRKGCGGWDERGKNLGGKARQVDCLGGRGEGRAGDAH